MNTKSLLAIAAATTVFGGVIAGEDASTIASANIVGYANVDSQKNKMDMAGANFVTIGEEGLDIQSIVMTGDGAEGTSYIMWWDAEAGKYSAKAVYANPLCDPGTDEDLDYGGWGDQLDWYPIEKTFTPGQGFWFQAAFDKVSLTTSGEVEQPETEYAGRALKKNKLEKQDIIKYLNLLMVEKILYN